MCSVQDKGQKMGRKKERERDKICDGSFVENSLITFSLTNAHHTEPSFCVLELCISCHGIDLCTYTPVDVVLFLS